MLRAVTALAASAVIALAACGSDSKDSAVQVTNRTPQACLDALDAGDAVISDAGDIFGIIGDALIAAGDGDFQPLLEAEGRMAPVKDHMIPKLDAYKNASAACRG
jgi:hypothetical protein